MTTRTRPSCRATPFDPKGPAVRRIAHAGPFPGAGLPTGGRPSSMRHHRSSPSRMGRAGRARGAPVGEGHNMGNIIRIDAAGPRSPRPARAPARPSPWRGCSPWPGPPCSRPWPAPAAMARTLTVSRPTDEAILRPAHAPAEALYDNSGTVWASWTSSSAPHPSAFSRPASRPATAFRCACAPCYFLIPGCTNLDRSRPATA